MNYCRVLVLLFTFLTATFSFQLEFDNQEGNQFIVQKQYGQQQDKKDFYQISVNNNQKAYQSNVQSMTMRLTPNQDIMTQITSNINQSPKRKSITALSIVSAAGSVKYCWIRMANQSTLTKINGPMEIVSLSGTFDINLEPHVHISVSRATGQTVGGHLPSLEQRQQTLQKSNAQGQTTQLLSGVAYDCPIFTTLQLVLLSHQNIIYKRKIDPATTFHELTISKKHIY